MKRITTLLLLLTALFASAQVQNMVVYRSDGSAQHFDVKEVDSVGFEQVPKWNNRSQEAQTLLKYLEDNVGKQILTGTHAEYHTGPLGSVRL